MPPLNSSGPGARDLGLLEDGGADARCPPGAVGDALALAVGLGHLDELLLKRGEILDAVDAGALVEQVLLFLQ